MRIRILHKPTTDEVDGIRLDLFEAGAHYEVGNHLGALMLAEGWAEPAASDEPGTIIPISDVASVTRTPPNLQREFWPPYYDSRPAVAADRRTRPRRKAN
jgi:hypothetical protein